VDPDRSAREGLSGARRGWQRNALVTSLASAVTFALLAWYAVAATGPARVDPSVQDFVLRHRVGWLTDTFRALTFLGSTPVLAGILVAFGVLVWTSRRDVIGALVPVVALVVTVLAKNAAKALIERPRPSPLLAIGSNTGFAFPSGHAADSLAAFALVALIASADRSLRAKRIIWSCAVVVILVVGASRVYLGSHWLTDVLGGWALALAIVSMLAGAFLLPGRSDRQAHPIKPPEGPART
jgi:undecaprenyl-diphosphatase